MQELLPHDAPVRRSTKRTYSKRHLSLPLPASSTSGGLVTPPRSSSPVPLLSSELDSETAGEEVPASSRRTVTARTLFGKQHTLHHMSKKAKSSASSSPSTTTTTARSFSPSTTDDTTTTTTTTSTTTTTARTTNRQSRNDGQVLIQMHLNLVPARTTCKECGMSYTRTVASDVVLHTTFHKAHLYGISLPAHLTTHASSSSRLSLTMTMTTKTEIVRKRTIAKDCSIVTVNLGVSARRDTTFVERVCEMVDLELNSALPPLDATYTAYLATYSGRCVSFLLVQPTRRAYPFLQTTGELDTSRPASVVLGVSRMWTCKTYRTAGLMRKLLDFARERFVYGSVVRAQEVCFTQLSQSGEGFARAYISGPSPDRAVLVYSD